MSLTIKLHFDRLVNIQSFTNNPIKIYFCISFIIVFQKSDHTWVGRCTPGDPSNLSQEV